MYFLYVANRETKSDLKDRNDYFAAPKDCFWVGFWIPHLIPVNANVHIRADPVTLASLRGSYVKRLPDLIMSVMSILGRRTLTYWL